MNHINSIQSFPLKVRQAVRPDVRPTNVDFYVAKTLYYNGWTTRLDFDIYPSGTTWKILQYTIKFYNNSMVLQFTTVFPYVSGQFRYIYEYGYIQSYKFKITVTAQYQSLITGEVITYTSPYNYQP
jgi:hypothetical protein